MKKILVANDDGIQAPGMRSLVEALGKFAEVYVAAPAEQQSGKSMAITFMREMHVEERELSGAVAAYAVEGTPADCVKWGIGKLESEGIKPDYIISGINMGHNLGAAAYYSGTISAAKEGALSGIRSIALSVGDHGASHFDYVLGMLPRLLEMSSELAPSVILSVNAPDLPSWDIKGVKIVPAAPFGYGELFLFGREESGDYQMRPKHVERDGLMRYDYDWMEQGYVAISPISTILSDRASLMKLKGLTMQAKCLTVIVDAQEGMLTRLKKPGRFSRSIEKLAHCVSRMGMPFLVTESADLGDTLPEIKAYLSESETVAHIQPDAWSAPEMDRFVNVIDVDSVMIAGAASNVELLQTALGFNAKGYETIILEDCCGAASKSDHRAAMRILEQRGCRISTMETEVMGLAGGCSRQVLDAVKNILFA